MFQKILSIQSDFTKTLHKIQTQTTQTKKPNYFTLKNEVKEDNNRR